MIKCVILDDELLAISYLKLLCEQIEGIEVVKAFNNPKTFLQEVENTDCDVCILDIEMPGMNGLQVAELIPGKKIIFTTAYKEYAAEAFDLDVVDYVRKPIRKERLAQAFDKIRNIIPEKKDFIEWHTNLGKTIIFTSQIIYIKASGIDSRDKEAMLDDNTRIILKNLTFKQLLDMLPEKNFAQINKKEMINIQHVKVFSSAEIIMDLASSEGNPVKLFVSDVFRAHISERLTR